MKWRMIHSWYRANVDSSSWMWNSDFPWLSWFLNINSLGPWFSIIVAKIHVFFLNERSLSWRKYWSRPCQREPKNEWCKSCGALVFWPPTSASTTSWLCGPVEKTERKHREWQRYIDSCWIEDKHVIFSSSRHDGLGKFAFAPTHCGTWSSCGSRSRLYSLHMLRHDGRPGSVAQQI